MRPAPTVSPTPIIFLHIPKTGGTSIRKAMANSYQVVAEMAGDNTNRSILFTDRFEQADAWAGHMPFGLHKHIAEYLEVCRCGELVSHHTETANHTAIAAEEINIRYFTVIRDPVARTISQFVEHTRHAEAGLRPVDLINPDKTMTAYLSGMPDSRKAVDVALDNLWRHFVWIGRTSQLNSTALFLHSRLGWQPCVPLPWTKPGMYSSVDLQLEDYRMLQSCQELANDRLLYNTILQRGPMPAAW